MSVTYTAVLDVSEGCVLFLSELLDAERTRRGTRKDTRSLQRLDRLRQPRRGHRGAGGASPGLHGARLAAKVAGHTHVILDGGLMYTDRIHTPGPTAGVDLWWSGKHKHHGGNIQVLSAPDGSPRFAREVSARIRWRACPGRGGSSPRWGASTWVPSWAST
jgi:hypothetical protein